MREYNQPREYFREKLVEKYVRKPSLYRNQNSMKEFVLVTTKDCSRCVFIKPKIKERCEKNWYKFKEMEYGEWMDEITSVPCAMIGDDVILNYDGIVELITNKRSFY